MSEWIEHTGTDIPVGEEILVDVKYRDGRKLYGIKAGMLVWKPTRLSKFDIVEYRISEDKQ
jgi:hypothetical protein